MLIHRLKVSGLLSFGPSGIDLPLQPLNVLIGANGSGKSNLLDVLSLLRAAPKRLSQPVEAKGGIQEWLWKAPSAESGAVVDVITDSPIGDMSLRHRIGIANRQGHLEVVQESIENQASVEHEPFPFLCRCQGRMAVLRNTRKGSSTGLCSIPKEALQPRESILSQIRDPGTHPVLRWL